MGKEGMLPSVVDGQTQKNSIDQRERIMPSQAIWLAGMFEIGGSMFFNRGTNKKDRSITTEIIPFFGYADQDLMSLKQMPYFFSGGIDPVSRTKSYRWYALKDDAVALAQTIEPYAPSRKTIINAFIDWQYTDYLSKQVAIASSVKHLPHNRNPIGEHEYDELIADPNFRAGVVDARIILSQDKSYRADGTPVITWPVCYFRTSNLPLLESMKNYYQLGSKILPHTSGRDSVKQPVYSWKLGKQDTKAVLSDLQNHLFLRRRIAKQILAA